MPLVLAIDDIKPEFVKYAQPGRKGSTDTIFFEDRNETPDAPTAFLVEYIPGRFSGAHYHPHDEFQILTHGKGTFGRHEVSPYDVHFARAFTPYGPLLSDKDGGWGFLTLRSRSRGLKRIDFDKLKQMPDRRPWQIIKKIAVPSQGPGVNLKHDPDIRDDQGLFTCTLTMGPNTRTTAPSPSSGDGQFVVVVKGSLLHDNREHKALIIVFVKPTEDAFQIQAGAQGLEAIVLNLPQRKQRAKPAKTLSTTAGFKKWQCAMCSFAYDEALGMPKEGIAAGTRWQDVPDTWSCPDCSASKSDFEVVEV